MGAVLVLGLVAWLGVVALWLGSSPKSRFASADAVIVLGAPLDGERPSTVFQARIDHGVALVTSGQARKLILTGGRTRRSATAEADAARVAAMAAGVPSSQILVDNRSRSTAANLRAAATLMRQGHLRTALIVTDPVHQRRAMWLAGHAGIVASPAPVPRSRYGGVRALAHEIAAFHRDLVIR